MAPVDRIRVLYIDDDTQLLEVIKDLLEIGEDIAVDTFDDVGEAVKAIMTKPYDVIISDYQMPETDGIELLKMLRSTAIDIPFVLFTGKGREEVAIEALNSGAYSYLQKGSDIDVVLAELRNRIKEGHRKGKATKDTIASEKMAWALLNLMDGPCLLIDRSYTIIAANENLPEMFNLEDPNIIGHSLIEITPKRHRDEVEKVLGEIRSSKLATSLTYSIGGKYLKMNLRPILDEAGDVDIIAVLSYDITDRIESEIELNRRLGIEKMISSVSSKLLSQRVDGFEDNIMSTLRTVGEFMKVDDIYFDVIDKSGSLVSVSEVHLGSAMPKNMIKKDMSPLKSKWISERIEQDGYLIIGDTSDLPEVAIEERKLLSDLGVRSLILMPLEINFYHTGLLKIADSKAWKKFHYSLIPQLKVIVELLCSYVRRQEIQIELNKKYESSIESERRLRSFLSNMPGMAYRCKNDRDWSMEYLSEGCHDLTGYEPDDMTGSKVTFGSIIYEDDRQYVWNEVQRALSMEQPYILTYRIIKKDGTILWISDQGSAVFNDVGEFQAFEGFMFDVSERVEKEEALSMTNKKLSLLTSVTRHDIMNQLIVLNSYLELLKKNPGGSSTNERIDKMMKTLRGIQESIYFTKEYEQIGSTEPDWIQLREIVEETAASIWSKDFIVLVDVDGLEIYADKMIRKVFLNLLENSMFHGEEVSVVRVSKINDNSSIKLIYEDDGCGIPDDEKALIFNKGYGKNTGFGLFLSREILELTGMKIKENGTKGKGARFEIIVPSGKFRYSK